MQAVIESEECVERIACEIGGIARDAGDIMMIIIIMNTLYFIARDAGEIMRMNMIIEYFVILFRQASTRTW